MSIKKKSYRSGIYQDIFAQAVQVGNIVYLAGQVGIDEKGTPGATIVEQINLAYRNIQRVLSEFNADLSNVVDETMFVTDVAELMENAEAVFAARAQTYGGIPEVANTLVEVGALVMPELKLEIKCVAHLES